MVMVALLITMSNTALAVSASQGTEEVQVILNGQKLEFTDAEPYIKNGRTLVPFSRIFQAFGMKVTWNGLKRTVYAKNDRTEIFLTIDSPIAYVNTYKKTLDVAPEIIGSRTFVPLSFIALSIGADVKWDGKTSTVTINTCEKKYVVGQEGTFGDIKFSIDTAEVNQADHTVNITGKISTEDKKLYIYVHESKDNYVLAKGDILEKEGDMYKFEASSFISSGKDFRIGYIIFGILDQEKKFVKFAEYSPK